jgi:hypothetical protein
MSQACLMIARLMIARQIALHTPSAQAMEA